MPKTKYSMKAAPSAAAYLSGGNNNSHANTVRTMFPVTPSFIPGATASPQIRFTPGFAKAR